MLATVAVSVAYQLYRIVPYTPFRSTEVKAAGGGAARARCSLMAANVRMSNRSARGLLASIARCRPDLILVVEGDDWWERRLRQLEADYPHQVKHPQANTYGMLLYSRLPLRTPRVEFLVQDDVPSIHAQAVLPSGDRCNVHMLHPHPPSPLGRDTTTGRDAELLVVAERVRRSEHPTLVAGDLNDVAWSRTTTLFQRISRLLDPRKGRGLYNTYNAMIPLLRFPVDHVFHSSHFTLAELTRLPAFGSDHFPIFVALELAPADGVNEQAPARTTAATRRARRKISRGLAGR